MQDLNIHELRGHVRMTYKEFSKIPYDGLGHHLVRGVHVITPAPSIIHQRISAKLFKILSNFVEENSLGEVMYSPIDVKFSDEDGYQPDLLYIEKQRLSIIEKNIINGPPDVIIEIISPGSLKSDRGWKLEMARKYNVKEYWLVDYENKIIEIYTKDTMTKYTKDMVVKSEINELSNLRIDTQKLFTFEN